MLNNPYKKVLESLRKPKPFTEEDYEAENKFNESMEDFNQKHKHETGEKILLKTINDFYLDKKYSPSINLTKYTSYSKYFSKIFF